MDDTTIDLRDRILLAVLPDVAFDGWTWPAMRAAAAREGLGADMADAVFPGGLADVLRHFSDWADRRMLAELAQIDAGPLRVRDRVREAVLLRLQVLEPWREQAKLAARHWAAPYRTAAAGRLLWRTADRIWIWAGDTATDYNRYTKRALLVSVLAAATVVWLTGDDATDLGTFVERRIDRVMTLGKFAGRFRRGQAAGA